VSSNNNSAGVPTVVSFPVELPSGGFLYTDETLKKGILNVRRMTVAEEELLGAQKDSDRIVVLDTIIKRCLIEKIPYDQLLVTDKLYILFALRQCSYGNEYKMTVKCDECATQFSHSLEFFSSFKIRALTEDDAKEGEPYTVTLPLSKAKVDFRMLRVADEDLVTKYGKRQMQRSAKGIGDPTYSYRLALHIVNVNGEALDVTKRLEFVKSLIGKDSAVFKNAVEEKQSGVRIDLEIECPSCGAVLKKLLQFNEEFFRPSSSAPEQ